MNKIPALLLAFVFWCGLVSAKEFFLSADSLSVVLAKNWKFSADDNPAMANADYNDSSWSTQSPLIDIAESRSGFFKGFGWFRYHFKTDSSLDLNQF